MNGITRQYENLANAIVELAVKDYKRMLERLNVYSKDYEAQSQKQRIEKFFRSDWYKALTNIDGEWLMKKIQSEV
ncbi:MAG: hypothetical protein ACK5I7_01005 [Anaerotignum sp.]